MATAAPVGNILVLDHLNINHEKGRHDVLKAFYFDVLGCAVDPRKIENLEKGKKTLWANMGINQLHLPEEDEAQVLEGTIVVTYPSLASLKARLASPPAALQGTRFGWEESGDGVVRVTCPWGNQFEIRGGDAFSRDPRGKQPGDASEPLGMPELRIRVPFGSNVEGIQRFYSQVMDSPAEVQGEGGGLSATVHCGEGQRLVFEQAAEGEEVVHSDYHVSMYIKDLPGTFERAEELGLIFVNPRFKRKAHNLEEAVDQCMFRILNIVDPDSASDGPILKLEHEIRSMVNKDGTPYKSCPFDT